MKHLLALLSGCLVCAPLCALTVESNTVTFTDDEMQRCAAEGGCIHATMKQISDTMDAVHARGFERGLHSCRNAT